MDPLTGAGALYFDQTHILSVVSACLRQENLTSFKLKAL